MKKTMILLMLLIIPMSVMAEELPDVTTVPFNYGYDSNTQVMTSRDGLNFSTTSQGWFEIERANVHQSYFGFGIEGDVDTGFMRKIVEDFTWSWSHSQDGDVHTFVGYNNQPVFNWTQVFTFYPDQDMKIEHILSNNWKDITNGKFWYIHEITTDDIIHYNDTYYGLQPFRNYHLTENLNDKVANAEILGSYNFDFTDIIDNGFDVTDVYAGNGSVIDKSGYTILAVGFTKNSGNFPNGASVSIDPTIETPDTSNDVGSWSNIKLDSNEVPHLIHWDATNSNLRYCNKTTGSWSCDALSVGIKREHDMIIDSNDVIHLAGGDSSTSNGKYCNTTIGSGVWNCEETQNTYTTDCGEVAIAIDSSDNPAILCNDYRGGTTYGWNYCDRSSGSWSCESVQSGTQWKWLFGNVKDSSGYPHIMGWNEVSPEDLYYCNKTTGSWGCSNVMDTDSYSTRYLAGGMIMDYNDNDHLHFAIRDNDEGVSNTIQHCNSTTYGSSWSCRALGLSEKDGWVSIDVDGAQVVHIGVMEASGGDSNYMYCNSTDSSYSSYNCMSVYTFSTNDGNNIYSNGDGVAVRYGNPFENQFSTDVHLVGYKGQEKDVLYIRLDDATTVTSYISATFNYSSVTYGTLTHNTSDNVAPNQANGVYNVTVDASGDYKIQATGSNFSDGGTESFSITNLKMDTNSTVGNLALGDSVSLSTSPQTIDTNIANTNTGNFHGYWLSIPENQYSNSYSTTLTITVSLV